MAVVARLKGHDLVAGLAQAQDDHGDRLGRPRSDQYLRAGFTDSP